MEDTLVLFNIMAAIFLPVSIFYKQRQTMVCTQTVIALATGSMSTGSRAHFIDSWFVDDVLGTIGILEGA